MAGKMLQEADAEAPELYRRYRPTSFDDLLGQDDISDMLENMIEQGKIPHCILATGPSGTGKTTTFRILKESLGCRDIDFKEINGSDTRGIDTIRDIHNKIWLNSSVAGGVRVHYIDEAHGLTKEAQDALLKMLEDTPPHVYFFLASTDPHKLKKTIITRSTHLAFRALTTDELVVLILDVFKKERGEKLSEEIATKIAELCEGSARWALVTLQQIIHMDMSDEDAVLKVVVGSAKRAETVELCRALINDAAWPKIAAIIKGIDDEPERVRRAIIGYMNAILLNNPKPPKRAADIIDLFRDNFFDCGQAGLTAMCFRATGG